MRRPKSYAILAVATHQVDEILRYLREQSASLPLDDEANNRAVLGPMHQQLARISHKWNAALDRMIAAYATPMRTDTHAFGGEDDPDDLGDGCGSFPPAPNG